MRSRNINSAVFLLVTWFGLAVGAADENVVAPPLEVTKLVATILPKSWMLESERTRIVVRPRMQPAFVNLINASSQLPNETVEDYYRRHSVRFDYQIALRFAPKLSPEQLQQVIKENESIRFRIQAIERNPLVDGGKGEVFFPKTKEGQTLSNEYFRLKNSIRALPDGYIGNVSVYVESTFLGYARFLHAETQQECDAVKKRLIDQLTPYSNDSPKRQ